MSLIRIVTDSTADIPASVRNTYAIEMVPLQVSFGETSFEDQVTLNVADFYEKLSQTEQFPTTSQPSPGRFLETYERILGESPDATILSLHLSSALSGTYQAALIGRSMLDDAVKDNVIIIDSKSASVGFGFVVVELGKAIQRGCSLEECLQIVASLLDKKRLYFIVDTLTYLHKGGRIGGAAAFVGSLLQMKPILSINDEGTVYSVDKVRGTNRALIKMIELLANDIGEKPIHIFVGHANALKQAEHLASMVANQLHVVSTTFTELGPVIGAHAGPGALAVVVYES